jgi:hypothetical protein
MIRAGLLLVAILAAPVWADPFDDVRLKRDAMLTGGAMQIAVADPTQANGGAIHIEIDRAAAGVIEKDDAISIDQMSPAVRLTVNVANAHGRSLKLKCATR